MIWSLPDLYDPAVADFARKLGCTWIGMVPVQPAIFANELCCHANTRRQAELVGGCSVEGYYFMSYDGGRDYQAIHHSVWRDGFGDLIDITPYEDERSAILFAILQKGRRPLPNSFFHSLASYERVTMEDYIKENIVSFYVYMLVDPRSNRPFYVGKGKGKRAQQHLYKDNTIASIRRDGLEPKIVIIAENILDEQLAYDMEARLIHFWDRQANAGRMLAG